MADLPGLAFSVSHTTRPRRSGEQNGHDYHFVSRGEFEQIRDQKQGGFLEWAEVHGNLYGTSRKAVENQMASGFDVILDIDVQGARQIKAITDSVSIFIAPPSLEELEKRLRKRGTEKEETIALRLKNAQEELQAASDYDYYVVNDDLNLAVRVFSSIVIAERSRGRRSIDGSFL